MLLHYGSQKRRIEIKVVCNVFIFILNSFCALSQLVVYDISSRYVLWRVSFFLWAVVLSLLLAAAAAAASPTSFCCPFSVRNQ